MLLLFEVDWLRGHDSTISRGDYVRRSAYCFFTMIDRMLLSVAWIARSVCGGLFTETWSDGFGRGGVTDQTASTTDLRLAHVPANWVTDFVAGETTVTENDDELLIALLG